MSVDASIFFSIPTTRHIIKTDTWFTISLKFICYYGPSVSGPNSRCHMCCQKSGFTPLWLIVRIGICDICDVSKILVSYQSGPNFFVSWMNGPSSICVYYFQNIHEHWRMKILTEEQSKRSCTKLNLNMTNFELLWTWHIELGTHSNPGLSTKTELPTLSNSSK